MKIASTAVFARRAIRPLDGSLIRLAVVDAPGAGPAEEGERLVVGVEHHLLRLARIGPHEHHPAVAEPDVRDLHRRRGAVDHHDLVAPVELVCLAGGEASCRRRAFRATARRPPPSPRSPGASSRPRSGARRRSRRHSRAPAAPRRSASASAAHGSVAQRSRPGAGPVRPARGRSSAGAGSSARRKTPSRPSGSPCAPSSAKPAAPGRSP